MSGRNELLTKIEELQDRLELKEVELGDVSNMGVMLTSMLDVDAILSAMMEMSLRTVSAEVGCILLSDGDRLVTTVSWGVDEEIIRKIKLDNSMDILEWTTSVGETVIVNDFHGDVDAKIEAVISVPISHKSAQIGVLVAVNKASGGGFTDTDKRTLERLVNFAAVAIENARLMTELLEKQKLEQELSLAKEIQRALLPEVEVSFNGAEIEGLYLPAGKVGGDYYDLMPISDSEFQVIVGDVSNKGVPAALMMTAARSAIRAEAKRGTDVAGIVNHINRILCLDVMKYPDIFISFVFAHFDLKKRKCTYTNAGHLPPFLFNKQTGDLRQLTTGGVIIGQFEDFEYKSETVDLSKDDRLLFFTDGATECVDASGEMYGRERLGQFFANQADVRPREFMQKLTEELDSFTEGTGKPQFDDIAAVVVEITGGSDG